MAPRTASIRAAVASLTASLVLLSARTASADVSAPLPGVVLVQRPTSAMTIANLCAPGVSVRATRFGERQATPQQWAEGIGAQVAINADFFDFPGWSWVLVRARGDGEDWPPEAQKLEQPSAYWQFGRGFADIQPSSLVPPAPWVTQIVGAYDPLIEWGQIHAFDPSESFMLAAYRRSAIGLSADRSVLFFYASNAAINGPDMAAEMISMAAEAGAPPIDVATNEDGGGSSQLYVQGLGQVIDSGRQVNDHLGLYATGQGPAFNCPTSRSDNASHGTATWAPGRLDVAIHGDDERIHHLAFDGGWHAWEPLGDAVTSSPAIASWAPNRLDAFAAGGDRSLEHVFWDGAAWGADNLGGRLASAPVVTSWGHDRLDVFALADDASLTHWSWAGFGWGMDSLGGKLASAPAVTSWSADRLDVFAIDAEGALAHTYWDGLAWGAWESLGGAPASALSAVSWSPYRLDVFATAADATLEHVYWEGAWGTDSLGGDLASAPTAASWGPHRLDVFAVGSDATLQHLAFDGFAWSGWESLGGELDAAHPPAVVAWAPNRLDVLAVGMDRAVWHIWWDGVAWGGPESLGGHVKSTEAPGERPGGDVDAPATAGNDFASEAPGGGGLSGECSCRMVGVRGSGLEPVLWLAAALCVARCRRNRARL